MGKGDETKRAILNEAIDHASQHGLQQLSIGGLADRVGMSKSGLFAHFKSKEQLQLDVIEAYIELYVENVITPSLSKPRGEARLESFFERWLEWTSSQPHGCLLENASVEWENKSGQVRDAIVASERDWFDFVSNAVRIAIDENQFREDIDIQQWVFDYIGIRFAYRHALRLLHADNAEQHARKSLASLLANSR